LRRFDLTEWRKALVRIIVTESNPVVFRLGGVQALIIDGGDRSISRDALSRACTKIGREAATTTALNGKLRQQSQFASLAAGKF
jgi:hypothetical protein